MRSILTIAIGLLFSFHIHGQKINAYNGIPSQDKILLQDFWKRFTEAVKNKDKTKLATLFEFPFYCRPCIDDETTKNADVVTVKVTKKLFNDGRYKVFFGQPIRDEVKKHKGFTTKLFHEAFDDKMKKNGYWFSYTIVAPSGHWEGLQGLVYVSKKEGQFKITGIDTVP